MKKLNLKVKPLTKFEKFMLKGSPISEKDLMDLRREEALHDILIVNEARK